MRPFDFAPLYRSTVGFDQLVQMLDSVAGFDAEPTAYPPYNIERLGETDPSTLARAISFIAKNRNSPMVEVSEVCGDLLSRELGGHYQHAYPLGIVATIAPLLGLLGMILGMIDTFETVALAGSLGDPTQLSAGISEALITTGLGLAIAIPFLALYHFFKHRTASFGAQLEEEVTSLLSAWLLKKN